jgi:hypothetical protein
VKEDSAVSLVNAQVGATGLVTQVMSSSAGDTSAAIALAFAFGVRVAGLNPSFAGELADVHDTVIQKSNDRFEREVPTSEQFDAPGFLTVADLSEEEAALAGLLLVAGVPARVTADEADAIRGAVGL